MEVPGGLGSPADSIPNSFGWFKKDRIMYVCTHLHTYDHIDIEL